MFIFRGLVPAWATLNTDFPNYYLSARLYLDGYPVERLADWAWMQRLKDHAGIDQPLVGFIPLTLFSSLVVAPLTALPILAAKRVWLAVSFLLLAAIGAILTRITKVGPRRIALLILIPIVPLRMHFHYGQQNVLLLFLVTLSAWAYFEERKFTAGAVLALASALKLYPAMLALLFVRKRQWRALAGLACGVVVVAISALALFGWEPVRTYLVEVAPRAVLRGEVVDPYTAHLNSASGMFRRMFVFEPDLNPQPLIDAPFIFAVLAPLFSVTVLIAWFLLLTPGKAPAFKEKLDWGISVSFLLVLSTAIASYHYCFLILGAVLAIDGLLAAGLPQQARLVFFAYAVVGLPYDRFFPDSPHGWRTPLGYPRLFAVALLCLSLAWAARALRTRNGTAARTAIPVPIWLGGLALVAFAIVSQVAHLRSQRSSYAQRLPSPALTNGEPATAGDRVYFVQMVDSGYALGNTAGGPLMIGPPGTDLLHPTVTLDGQRAWMEVAGRSRSHVVAFAPGQPTQSIASLPVVADDAEQPVVSGDGRRLAFLRRTRGRASLWLMDLRRQSDLRPAPAPREIAGVGYDVFDAGFFPDGRIVFTGWTTHGTKLFVYDPDTERTDELAISRRPVRYPAVSPDGRWLAYSERSGSNWQLNLLPLPSGVPHPLTNGECNSIEPAWYGDSRTLAYATDCGRGLGETALARLSAVR